jgi:hypothetical protein
VIPVILLASALPGVILAIAVFLKLRPPDLSEVGIRSLRRGLWLGASSCAALPLLWALAYFHPLPFGQRGLFVICGFVGGFVNLVAMGNCLKEMSAPGLVVVSLLGLNQLFWMFFTFMAFGDF